MDGSGFVCLVGTLYLFYLILKCLRILLNSLKTTLLGGSLDFCSFGEWAVVTGCTDGIGKAYAKQLASKGLNIVLMSRSQEKLNSISAEIKNDYKVETKIIQIDFSGGHEIYDSIPKQLEGLEIGILVNNVGFCLHYPEYFSEISLEDTWRIINVNMMAMTMLTRLILPAMTERGKGVVINLSSFTGSIFSPFVSEYSATKSFVDKLSRNLLVESANKGIIIQLVKPLFVATNMTRMKASLFTPSPDDYVRAVLKKVGTVDECIGYWPHELQALFYSFVPVWLGEKIIFYTFKALRDKYIRKNLKKAKSS